MSVGDEFPHVPGALFAEKVSDFIASLKAASLGSGKTIGCLLKVNSVMGKNKKARSDILMGKLFESKCKMSGAIGKASTPDFRSS